GAASITIKCDICKDQQENNRSFFFQAEDGIRCLIVTGVQTCALPILLRRLWMMRPWWAVIEQNVQPPKQPRMIVTESLIISCAGIGSAYDGWARRVYGRS